MRVGVVFPQTEIGPDPQGVRDYTVAVEEMGYSYLQIYDHVLGADTASRPNWTGAYRLENQFHEVLVVFGYMAAITRSIELVTGVLVLPQRQAALVAKQAAEVDVLSNGRLILGVGVGWNAVEFEALGENFHTRGRRIEEQIAVLRELWTKPSVNFQGRGVTIPDAGINPLPVQRPIPIWMGGNSAPVLDRVGRLADGWLPQWRSFPSVDQMRAAIAHVRDVARSAGRDPSHLAVAGVMSIGSNSPDQWRQEALDWMAAGATHMAVNTMGANLSSPDEHIAALRRFVDEVVPALDEADAQRS
ncbi:MAG: TIGR03619 family F420-dependent LLM class oxidoreductase [Anaerolineae bacterium]